MKFVISTIKDLKEMLRALDESETPDDTPIYLWNNRTGREDDGFIIIKLLDKNK